MGVLVFSTALVSFSHLNQTPKDLCCYTLVLCSLVLGVISRGVNKVPFDVMSRCIWCIFLMLRVGSFLRVRRVQTRKKLWRILLDVTKCTEVGLSYVCNNISTPMATQLCIRLRWDLLLATRLLQVQQRLTKTPRQQKKPNDLSYTMLNRVQPT